MKAAKKSYLFAIIASADWHPAQAFRLTGQVTSPRSESLNVSDLTFISDNFALFSANKISQIHSNLEAELICAQEVEVSAALSIYCCLDQFRLFSGEYEGHYL